MSVLGYGWRLFRRRGLGATVLAVFNGYIYRSYKFVVVRGPLAGPPAADHLGDVVFRLATPSDLNYLDELDRRGHGSFHRVYLEEDNDWLFVARHDDRIVAALRYSRAVPPLASRVVRLAPGQVWASDVFCLPEYRSQGIARHLLLFVWRFLASRGYTEVLGVTAADNIPSLRMSLRAGTEPVYYVSYFRFLFYERLRVSKELPREIAARLKRSDG